MSRTHRNTEHIHRCAIRFPKTFSEIKQLDAILNHEEEKISKFSRIHSRKNKLPTAWDDLIVSAYLEKDFKTHLT